MISTMSEASATRNKCFRRLLISVVCSTLLVVTITTYHLQFVSHFTQQAGDRWLPTLTNITSNTPYIATTILNSPLTLSSFSSVILDPCRPLVVRRDDDDVAEGLRQICRPLIARTSSSIVLPNGTATPNDYVRCAASLSNCSALRHRLGYYSSDVVGADELEFPLAFSLLTHENFEQTERLLRLIYRPHNVYCVHVDAKAAPEMHAAAAVVFSCLPNVVIAKPPIAVEWGESSLVDAEMYCIKRLLDFDDRWRYFINLVGRDFPLRTNAELVAILKSYRGANDVDGSRKVQYYPDWFNFKWFHGKRGGRKHPPPHGFVIAKGSTHMAATRALVKYALHNNKAKDLFFWIRDVKFPDEHFFPTLNHNPQFGIPGSFRGDPDTKTSLVRLKLWSFDFQTTNTCAGRYIRYVCNIGVGDLPWVTSSPHMFVNKIRLEDEPTAFLCLEQWYKDRVVRTTATSNGSDNAGTRFNVDLYAAQPFVSNHV